MSEIKVLQIGKYYPPYRGGLESSLYNLVDTLKNSCRFQVLVANTQAKTVIENNGMVTIVRLARFGTIFSQPITPTLLLWMKRIKTDIVHLHFPNPLAVISYLICRPKAKLIISYHSDVVRQRLLSIFLQPFLTKILCRADAIVVTSQNLIDSSPVLFKFKHKCRVIAHGIDLEEFCANPKIKETAKNIKNSFKKPIILFVGRLVYYKGLKYLLKDIKNIDINLIIIGKGELEFKLKKMADHLGINQKISWMGDVDQKLLPAYYHSCDIFVLPSCDNSEAFGLVILEAQAAGKPIISTALPTGVSFNNINRQTGLVVAPRDCNALAVAINELLLSEKLRQEFGKNGKLRVEKEFGRREMARNFLALYENIKHP